MTHSEVISNIDNFAWPNMSGALARQTKKGTVLTDTVKTFQQGTSEQTESNVYCLTEKGYRFRFPRESAPQLTEGSTVKFRKEESTIDNTVVHFFQFVEVAMSAAVAAPATTRAPKAAKVK